MKLVDKKILSDLYCSDNGLFAYTLILRHKIDPKDVAEFISKYTNEEVISYIEKKLILTSMGRRFVERKLYSQSSGSSKRVLSIFLGEKISIDTPYVPKLSEVSIDVTKKGRWRKY